jgi:outer membrane protein OmpA-like peptidoglycan-associated protein
LDSVARAKIAFFACLGVSLAILVLVDAVIGPAAFAVQPKAAEPAAPATVPPTAPSSVASVAPAASELAIPAHAEAPALDAEAPSTAALPRYAGGKTNGVVATFEFEQASADLSALQALAKQMHDDTTSEIVLEGHSDPSGNEYRNLSLSLDRANWAADRLSEYGINRMRIRTVGLGSARPIVDAAGDAGAINRRVEVRWVSRSADGGAR